MALVNVIYYVINGIFSTCIILFLRNSDFKYNNLDIFVNKIKSDTPELF